MTPYESTELTECLDCGAVIDPPTDRAYERGDEEVYCFECAVRRGGVYDDDRERWTIAPDVEAAGDAHPSAS